MWLGVFRCCLPLVVCASAAACSFDQGGVAAGGDDGGVIDAPTQPPDGGIIPADASTGDADPNAPDAAVVPADAAGPLVDAPGPLVDAPDCTDWTTNAGHFDPCDIAAPGAALILSAVGEYTYNTTNATLRNPTGTIIAHTSEVIVQGVGTARLVSVGRFELGAQATLRATGDLPLIIASWSSIRIDGVVDVSSDRAASSGAGVDPGGVCEPDKPTAGGDDLNMPGAVGGGGGGGGAGFQGDGGDGGGAETAAKGAKGSKVGLPLAVRGGCIGAAGGAGDVAGPPGGQGGGAIQLTALATITVTGTLDAGGAGGGASRKHAGGGGGGSGGFVGLDAASVRVMSGAALTANGGGGGEGADNNEDGDPGDDALPSSGLALGGKGGANDGGDGGDGAIVGDLNGMAGKPKVSGGGGGGGVGYVIVWSPDAVLAPAADVSPDPTLR